MSMGDQRWQDLHFFIQAHLKHNNFSIKPLAGDASFRRYFRVHSAEQTWVAMDAPPDKESCDSFVALAQLFRQRHIHVPEIIAMDLARGYLLLTDLGDNLYFRILNADNAAVHYENALRALIPIQSCSLQMYAFPDFTPLITEELLRFREWYLIHYLQRSLTQQEETLLATTFTQLLEMAVNQPQVCVHRDYHSRNLMQLPGQAVGILDFQDAVWGPVTYDLVSLIRDCYIDWPLEQVTQWARFYHQLALDYRIMTEKNFAVFQRWFDWMGIQRHLKAIYIFARKFKRDQNSNYLNDIPRALNYVLQVSANYPELKDFREFLSAVTTQ